MNFSHFDIRKYRTLSVREGYSQWSATYEDTVKDEMDQRLLARAKSVRWDQAKLALDLACGTGRIGTWLREHGLKTIDGIDLTGEMLDRARARNVYRHLSIGDVRDTKLPADTYDLITQSLADEHLPDLAPLYREAARVGTRDATFVIVGYHPHFLMSGIPTHFDSTTGEPLAVESYVHLTSDHIRAAHASGWTLREMDESLIDEAWVQRKPKWRPLRNHPISFLMVWAKR